MQNYTKKQNYQWNITMLFIQDNAEGMVSQSWECIKNWIQTMVSQQCTPPFLENWDPDPRKQKERYRQERIPGSDICLTLVHLKSNLWQLKNLFLLLCIWSDLGFNIVATNSQNISVSWWNPFEWLKYLISHLKTSKIEFYWVDLITNWPELYFDFPVPKLTTQLESSFSPGSGDI